MSNGTTPSIPNEKIYSTFTKHQGAQYAKTRPNYHPNLYKAIIAHHTSTNGQLNTILDVGCGPKIAVRALAPTFTHAIGLDPCDGMIATARTLGGTTSNSLPIRYEISTAEDLGWHLDPRIKDGSVNLITAANAAHWFDAEKFWGAAERVLRVGGTVAIWGGTGNVRVSPDVPNVGAIQAGFEDMDNELKPFLEPGNLLGKNSYRDLVLPWMLEPVVREFGKDTLFRKQWNANNGEEFFEAGRMEVDLDVLEVVQGTLSLVQR